MPGTLFSMDDFLACLAGKSRRLPAGPSRPWQAGRTAGGAGRAAISIQNVWPRRSNMPVGRAGSQGPARRRVPSLVYSTIIRPARPMQWCWRQSKQAAYLAAGPPDAVSVIVAKLASQDDDTADSVRWAPRPVLAGHRATVFELAAHPHPEAVCSAAAAWYHNPWHAC